MSSQESQGASSSRGTSIPPETTAGTGNLANRYEDVDFALRQAFDIADGVKLEFFQEINDPKGDYKVQALGFAARQHDRLEPLLPDLASDESELFKEIVDQFYEERFQELEIGKGYSCEDDLDYDYYSTDDDDKSSTIIEEGFSDITDIGEDNGLISQQGANTEHDNASERQEISDSADLGAPVCRHSTISHTLVNTVINRVGVSNAFNEESDINSRRRAAELQAGRILHQILLDIEQDKEQEPGPEYAPVPNPNQEEVIDLDLQEAFSSIYRDFIED